MIKNNLNLSILRYILMAMTFIMVAYALEGKVEKLSVWIMINY